MAQLQLEGAVAVDDRDDIIAGQRQRIAQLQQELAEEHQRNSGVDDGVKNLRKALTPLYRALQQVFGEMDGMGVSETSTASAPTPKKSAAWDSWKQRLGGATAKAIDVLMLHGELNQTQLRIHLGCATGTITNVVTALNKCGLIVKENGKIRLKEL